MLNHPPIDHNNPILNKNPLDLEFIQSHQAKDLQLKKALREEKEFTQVVVGNVTLIHFKNDRMDKPKIVVPYSIQYPSIRWMHSLIGHAGISRLSAILKRHFWFPNMTKSITEFVSKCEFCQRYNKQTVKYGHIPQSRSSIFTLGKK